MDNGTKNTKNMSRSSISLAIFNNSISYLLNNQPLNIEIKTSMLVTQGLIMVEAHGKQSLRHLVNIGRKKRTGALGTGENGTNTGLKITTQGISKCNTIPQKIRPTAPNCPKKIIEYKFGIS